MTEQQFSRAKIYREIHEELDEAATILERLEGGS
jgi:hypothetical protein